MFSIILISISPQKAGPHQTLCEDYVKRLRPFARIVVKELKAEPFHSVSDKERVFKAEATRIRAAIPKEAFVVALTENGKTFDSPALAKQIAHWGENGARPIVFILGGPLGLDRELIKEANTTLSLSPLTFPHDLARVILLEQLYRAMTILHKKTYHY